MATKIEYTDAGKKSLRFDTNDILKNLKTRYEGHCGNPEAEQHAFELDEAQIRYDIDRDWHKIQEECDGNNISEAFKLLDGATSREATTIKAYIKRTLKEMGWTYSQPIKWEKQWDVKEA